MCIIINPMCVFMAFFKIPQHIHCIVSGLHNWFILVKEITLCLLQMTKNYFIEVGYDLEVLSENCL